MPFINRSPCFLLCCTAGPDVAGDETAQAPGGVVLDYCRPDLEDPADAGRAVQFCFGKP
jgi:hypothetical protein